MKSSSYKKLVVFAFVITLAFIWLPKNIASAQGVNLSAGAPTGVVTVPPTTATLPASIGNTVPTPTPQTGTTSGGGGTQSSQLNTNNAFTCSFAGSGIATCTIYLVSQAIIWILKLFISLGALLIQIALQVNQNLFNAPVVTIGFSVSLAIANLGFVLGIIIIALATILRSQSYGAKQLLWKLVVMAILVNFGLVITSPIVNFADSMTNYFMGQISGASSSAAGFTSNLVNAFSPQTLSEPSITNPQQVAQDIACQSVGVANAGAGVLCNVFYTIKNVLSTNPSDVFVRVLLSSIFAIVLAALIAFVLIILSVLLLVRYVYLAILLVLLPFAWLMWIFPKFSGEFHKWWSNFVKWTFFPTAALFFIYLVLATITSMAYQQSALQVVSSQIATSQQAAAGIFSMTGLIEMIQQMANEFVLAGLLLGGLFAAQSLAGKAGGMVVEGGKSAVGWAGGKAGSFAGRQGRKAAARAVPESVKQNLQSGKYRFVPKRLQVAAGIGLGNVQKAGGSRLVDQESTWAKEQGKDVDAAHRMLGSGGLSEAKQFALLKELNNNKRLDPTKKIDGQDIGAFLKDESRFDKYGQKGLRDDLNKSVNGASSSTMTALAALAAAGGPTSEAAKTVEVKDDAGILGEAGKTVNALELLQKSIEKTARNMDKNGVKKQNLNYMYGDATLKDDSNKDLRIKQLKALIKNKPQLISAHLPGMSSQQVDNFSKLFDIAVLQERKGADDPTRKRLDEIQASFKKALARNIMGLIPDEEEKSERVDEPKVQDTNGKKI